MRKINEKPAVTKQTGSSRDEGDYTTLTQRGKPEYKVLLVALGQNELISPKDCTCLLNAMGLKEV